MHLAALCYHHGLRHGQRSAACWFKAALLPALWKDQSPRWAAKVDSLSALDVSVHKDTLHECYIVLICQISTAHVQLCVEPGSVLCNGSKKTCFAKAVEVSEDSQTFKALRT